MLIQIAVLVLPLIAVVLALYLFIRAAFRPHSR
jgi:hypothetical protein